MQAYGGTPHIVTGDTTNLMVIGRELRLPDRLECHPLPTEIQSISEYVLRRQQRLKEAHEVLREAQIKTSQADQG